MQGADGLIISPHCTGSRYGTPRVQHDTSVEYTVANMPIVKKLVFHFIIPMRAFKNWFLQHCVDLLLFQDAQLS